MGGLGSGPRCGTDGLGQYKTHGIGEPVWNGLGDPPEAGEGQLRLNFFNLSEQTSILSTNR